MEADRVEQAYIKERLRSCRYMNEKIMFIHIWDWNREDAEQGWIVEPLGYLYFHSLLIIFADAWFDMGSFAQHMGYINTMLFLIGMITPLMVAGWYEIKFRVSYFISIPWMVSECTITFAIFIYLVFFFNIDIFNILLLFCPLV